MTQLPTLRVNMRAIFDSFSGAIPVRVLSIVPFDPSLCGTTTWPNGRIRVAIRMVRDFGPYRKDEVIETGSTHVVPPTAFKRPAVGGEVARVARYLVKIPS